MENNNENIIYKISNKKITLGLASDAIGTLAYDGDRSTGGSYYSNKRLNIDSSVWGREMSIYSRASEIDRYNSIYLYAYNSNNELISSLKIGECGFNSKNITSTITIPINTSYIIAHIYDGYNNPKSLIYEIWLNE